MYDCVYADVCEYVHVDLCARTHRFYMYHHDDFLACAYAVIKNFMQESKQRPWILQGKTLMALITNIEGREWQRCYMDRTPDHPRASSTDDVEFFFSSVMRDSVGRNFITKQVKYWFRKVCAGFTKRMASHFTTTRQHIAASMKALYQNSMKAVKNHAARVDEFQGVNNLLPLNLDEQQCQSGELYLYIHSSTICHLNCHHHPPAPSTCINIPMPKFLIIIMSILRYNYDQEYM